MTAFSALSSSIPQVSPIPQVGAVAPRAASVGGSGLPQPALTLQSTVAASSFADMLAASSNQPAPAPSPAPVAERSATAQVDADASARRARQPARAVPPSCSPGTSTSGSGAGSGGPPVTPGIPGTSPRASSRTIRIQSTSAKPPKIHHCAAYARFCTLSPEPARVGGGSCASASPTSTPSGARC